MGSLRMFPFVMGEKRLIGSVYGSGNPLHDIANLVALYQKGRIKLGELTRTYPWPGSTTRSPPLLPARAAGE